MMSMAGLVIAWRVFPFITDPLFSMLLKVVHPGESYSRLILLLRADEHARHDVEVALVTGELVQRFLALTQRHHRRPRLGPRRGIGQRDLVRRSCLGATRVKRSTTFRCSVAPMK